MTNFNEQKRFINYWLVFFGLHLFLLLFAIWNVYAVRQWTSAPLVFFSTNNLLFDLSFIFAAALFGVSTILKKSFGGFVWSFAMYLTISFTGLIVLFATSSFYFLLWFIIGLAGMGAQLFRFQKALEKYRNAEF